MQCNSRLKPYSTTTIYEIIESSYKAQNINLFPQNCVKFQNNQQTKLNNKTIKPKYATKYASNAKDNSAESPLQGGH